MLFLSKQHTSIWSCLVETRNIFLNTNKPCLCVSPNVSYQFMCVGHEQRHGKHFVSIQFAATLYRHYRWSHYCDCWPFVFRFVAKTLRRALLFTISIGQRLYWLSLWSRVLNMATLCDRRRRRKVMSIEDGTQKVMGPIWWQIWKRYRITTHILYRIFRSNDTYGSQPEGK